MDAYIEVETIMAFHYYMYHRMLAEGDRKLNNTAMTTSPVLAKVPDRHFGSGSRFKLSRW
jgi:hypothetical protein